MYSISCTNDEGGKYVGWKCPLKLNLRTDLLPSLAYYEVADGRYVERMTNSEGVQVDAKIKQMKYKYGQ